MNCWKVAYQNRKKEEKNIKREKEGKNRDKGNMNGIYQTSTIPQEVGSGQYCEFHLFPL